MKERYSPHQSILLCLLIVDRFFLVLRFFQYIDRRLVLLGKMKIMTRLWNMMSMMMTMRMTIMYI